MSARYDAPLIAGKGVYGVEGLGVLGSVIRATTATGQNGAGILYNDWNSSADDSVAFRALVLSGAPAGTLFYEDGSFDVPAGTAEGTYTVTYELFADGVSQGTTAATIVIGSGAGRVANLSLQEPAKDTFTGSATRGASAARTASMARQEPAKDTFTGRSGDISPRVTSMARQEPAKDTARGVARSNAAQDDLIAVAILNGVELVVRSQLEAQGIKVYRRRARALNANDAQSVVLQIAGARGERYLQDGSTDWAVTIRILALGRCRSQDDGVSADQVAGRALLAAHQALQTNPTLGIEGLDWNNSFSMAEDDEDFDEDLSAMVALYEYQIVTPGTAAALAG